MSNSTNVKLLTTGHSFRKGRQVSAKSGSLSIASVQLGPRKLSVIWSSGVSAIQGLLKY